MRKQPERLTFAEYMPPHSSLQIFETEIITTSQLHWHEFYEVTLIVRGRGTNIVNGHKHSVMAGDIFLMTPADIHELVADVNYPIKVYNIIFSDDMLDDEMRQLLFYRDISLMTRLRDEVYLSVVTEYQRVGGELNQPRAGSMRLIKGSMDRILVELVRTCEQQLAYTGTVDHTSIHIGMSPGVRKALVYIQHHFREHLTLEEVSKQASLAPNYFSECFHAIVGVSYQHYLQELRVRFAKSLLKSSALSITEICFASGFNNLSHFERVFKQRSNMTPRAYRQTEQGG